MTTIVALFDTFEHAGRTVDELEKEGFSRSEISLVAPKDRSADDSSDTTEMGAILGAGAGILAGVAAVAIPGIGAVFAIGPIIAGGLLGALAGGLVGSLVKQGVSKDEAEVYAEGVRRGGTLLTLAVSDADVPRAREIISKHNPVDLREPAETWRRSGWESGRAMDAPDLVTAPLSAVAIPVPGAQPTRDLAGQADLAGSFGRYEPDFKDDFDRSFPGSGYTFEQCKPAYEFGCALASEARQSNWDIVEPRARGAWEKDHPGTWNRMKRATRYGFERARAGEWSAGF